MIVPKCYECDDNIIEEEWICDMCAEHFCSENCIYKHKERIEEETGVQEIQSDIDGYPGTTNIEDQTEGRKESQK